MASYLDKTGLQRFWTKIKAYFIPRSIRDEGTSFSWSLFQGLSFDETERDYSTIVSVEGIETNAHIVTPNGDLIRTGEIVESLSRDYSLASGSYTDVLTVTLGAGTWLIIGYAQMSASATGQRFLCLSNSSTTSGALSYNAIDRTSNSGNYVANLHALHIRKVSSSLTVHAIAYQNCGSALTCQIGIQAIRIA